MYLVHLETVFLYKAFIIPEDKEISRRTSMCTAKGKIINIMNDCICKIISKRCWDSHM